MADGRVTDLSGWESGLTSVDRLSGLWSADLLLVQVRLMSRLPLLEHAFGRDRLVQTHRVVGFLSFDLMLVHVVTIIAGYAGARRAALPGTTWDLVATYGGLLPAVAATGCLIMVVVTSVKCARRRLRYESRHLLHLYAYLGSGWRCPISCTYGPPTHRRYEEPVLGLLPDRRAPSPLTDSCPRIGVRNTVGGTVSALIELQRSRIGGGLRLLRLVSAAAGDHRLEVLSRQWRAAG